MARHRRSRRGTSPRLFHKRARKIRYTDFCKLRTVLHGSAAPDHRTLLYVTTVIGAVESQLTIEDLQEVIPFFLTIDCDTFKTGKEVYKFAIACNCLAHCAVDLLPHCDPLIEKIWEHKSRALTHLLLHHQGVSKIEDDPNNDQLVWISLTVPCNSGLHTSRSYISEHHPELLPRPAL